MSWTQFPWFAVPALLLWLLAALAALRGARRRALWWSAAGLVVFSVFLAGLWCSLERPPMRTMGETRLWFTFFLALTGLVVYARWRYRWMPSFGFVMCLVFSCINFFKPELHNKTLMPALQSPWFTPHVTVYMVAYALLGVSAMLAFYLLWIKRKPVQPDEMVLCDHLVSAGLGCLTLGMLFGAIWAGSAWGRCWTWDPKETWAAATWLMYLCYLHLRRSSSGLPRAVRMSLLLLLVAFVCLQMCWYGVNFLPSAQGASMHTYNQ